MADEPIIPIKNLPFDGPPTLHTMEMQSLGKSESPVASIELRYDDSHYLTFFSATGVMKSFNEHGFAGADDEDEDDDDWDEEGDAAIEALDSNEDDDDEVIDVDEDDEDDDEDDEDFEPDEKNRKFYRTPQNAGFMQDYYQDVTPYDPDQLYTFNMESGVESAGTIYFSFSELIDFCSKVKLASETGKIACVKFNSGNRPINSSTIWVTFFAKQDHKFCEVLIDNLYWTNSLIFPKQEAMQFFQSVASAVAMLEADNPTDNLGEE